MIDRPTAPDLRALDGKYEIIGELRGAADTQRYVARRRDGGTETMITVVHAPEGDENNALAHLASDTQQLTNLTHASVPRVLGGQWLGADTFAVVNEPVHGTTLAELVSAGERLSNARIAVVLQEVDGVLDWARGQGIVHRKVTPETLWFEPGTDRVIVSFAPARIPISGVPDARGDAKTIGTLAWAMLAGRRYDEHDDKANPPLGEVRPDLAARVIGATERMVRAETHDERPDVPGYLALIASGDVLRSAEVEMAALQEEFAERHRIALANYENQRAAIEAAAIEHAAHLAKERAAFERLVQERQEHLAVVRAELDTQRVELERRLAEFDERRTAFEKARLEAARGSPPRATQLANEDADAAADWMNTRWAIPASLAGIAILLLAGLVAALSHRQRPPVSAGGVLAPHVAPFVRPVAPTHRLAPRRPAVNPDTLMSRLDSLPPDTTDRQPETR